MVLEEKDSAGAGSERGSQRPRSHEWRRHGCCDLHPADSADFRPARPGAEVGRRTVSYENVVGLVLAALTALYLTAALLFPERF